MEKILFRGKTPSQDEYLDDGEWVQGFYTCFNGKEHRIYSGYAETDCGDYYPDWCNIRPETVGQYTGLTDKNGKKIFEGDIVKREYTLHHGETKTTRETQIGVVKFNNRGEFIATTVKGRGNWFGIGVVWKGDYIEIIGNIYDNPELLKGADDGT